MRIYVGNISYELTEDELRKEFEPYGKVTAVSIPTDKYSGRPRGFAFVEMPTISEGQAAISALNGKTVKDRQLTVNAARERSSEGGGGGGGGYRGGSRGGGGGGGGGGYGKGRQRRY